MATLADELLADLMSDGSDAEDNEFVDEEEQYRASAHGADAMDEDDESGNGYTDLAMSAPAVADMQSVAAGGSSAVADAQDLDEARARVSRMQSLGGISDIRSVSGLMKTLRPVLDDIKNYQSLPPDQQTRNLGSIEDNPEYKLLVKANDLSTKIDNETILIHKFIRDHYSVRFPELDSLILNPLLYAKTVAIIGNGPMDAMDKLATDSKNIVGLSLKQLLDGPTLMVVRLEATKTRGVPMPEEEIAITRKGCEMSMELDAAKKLIVDYVQSKMHLFAPNLTVLVGSETAAQLVNTAGGLIALAKTPACNISAMGVKRQTFGLAKNTSVRRQGHLYHSPLVMNVPPDVRVEAMRIVGAKLVLAARCDQTHYKPDGSEGERLRKLCEDRLDKLQQPAPNSRGVRALPVPDDKPARKRGGRRARKAKEQWADTEFGRAQNRMAMDKAEEEIMVDDDIVGLGMVGQKEDGKIRAMQIDQRTRAKLSKKNQGWGLPSSGAGSGLASSIKGFGSGTGTVLGPGLRSSGVGGGAGAGTSSVIAFTPFQGLELINPKAKEEMDRKRKADEAGWFASGTFTQIGGTSSKPGQSGAVDSAGFKVPALPAIKRLKKAG